MQQALPTALRRTGQLPTQGTTVGAQVAENTKMMRTKSCLKHTAVQSRAVGRSKRSNARIRMQKSTHNVACGM